MDGNVKSSTSSEANGFVVDNCYSQRGNFKAVKRDEADEVPDNCPPCPLPTLFGNVQAGNLLAWFRISGYSRWAFLPLTFEWVDSEVNKIYLIWVASSLRI
jgi:hypothetical protein